MALAQEPSFLRELSRTATAVADVAEAAGSLGAGSLHLAANATVAVTTTAASLATSSLSLAREAWTGVDLLNVTINRSHGRVVASNMSEVSAWVKNNSAFDHFTVDVDRMLQPGLQLSMSMPLTEWADSMIAIGSGSWSSWKMSSRYLRTHHIAVAFEFHFVSFEVRWSNPLWEVWGLHPSDCSEEVLRVLKALLQGMPEIPFSELSLQDSALGVNSLPALDPPASEEARGWSWRARGMVLMFLTGLGYGMFLLFQQSAQPHALSVDTAFHDIATPAPSEHWATPPTSPLQRLSDISVSVIQQLGEVFSSSASSGASEGGLTITDDGSAAGQGFQLVDSDQQQNAAGG